ncbi:MAG TPA: hypothetical protein VL528_12050 [Oxalicibacterium sp.]|nr:hypothetical protein [Oxalicibacterium sp.]
MFKLFSSSQAASPVPTAYSLNRQANRIAQSNPALAAELRMRAYTPQNTRPAIAQKQPATPARRSAFALNSKANRIAQSKPELAIQLRLLAAYA